MAWSEAARRAAAAEARKAHAKSKSQWEAHRSVSLQGGEFKMAKKEYHNRIAKMLRNARKTGSTGVAIDTAGGGKTCSTVNVFPSCS